MRDRLRVKDRVECIYINRGVQTISVGVTKPENDRPFSNLLYYYLKNKYGGKGEVDVYGGAVPPRPYTSAYLLALRHVQSHELLLCHFFSNNKRIIDHDLFDLRSLALGGGAVQQMAIYPVGAVTAVLGTDPLSIKAVGRVCDCMLLFARLRTCQKFKNLISYCLYSFLLAPPPMNIILLTQVVTQY